MRDRGRTKVLPTVYDALSKLPCADKHLASLFSVVLVSGMPVVTFGLTAKVTKGHGVQPNENWVVRFEEWWNQTFPLAQTKIQNGAVAATGSDYFSMCFLEHIDADVDLILTELAVNDQRCAVFSRAHVCFADVYRHEGNAESFEWLMRALLELPSRPAV